MPRRRKPPGYEKWTWAEINAGRRMSKTEKRWNRAFKSMNWEQRPNGTYAAPRHARPFIALILILLFVLAVAAPNGLDNAHGGAGLIAALAFLLLIPAFLMLAIFGPNNAGDTSPGSDAASGPRGATRPKPRS